uniref:Senp3 protein n=1 Tax=Rattus norvegicus TaxID=10116 RepID=Q5FVF2_RAT|nr:Senp3 protein [Rattus norvegicus]
MNMYGDLVMDTVPEKVHFFNSFFYDKLRTKGYDGVKRWTKNVSYTFTTICIASCF